MKKVLFWILAIVITLAAAVYQRMTGPTYPIMGASEINGVSVSYYLPRSHEIGEDCTIRLKAENPEITGVISFRRHKTGEDWTQIPMTRAESALMANLPEQPPAGKLDYNIILSYQDNQLRIPEDELIVIRFKGKVPGYVLWPHVIIIFLAMLFSTRTGIEALDPKGNTQTLAIWTLALLFVGGMILGPLVQKFAFDAFWTGFPFGTDLTDNKTLIAFVAWIAAVIAGRKGRNARAWVLAASIILLLIYLIPHSLFGSELDYSQTG